MKLLHKTDLPEQFRVLTWQIVVDADGPLAKKRTVLGVGETQSAARIMAMVANPHLVNEIKSLQTLPWEPVE